MNEVATKYLDRGRKYLSQAGEEFAVDDLTQASEKGWGAAAQLVKAVGAERGWSHEQHRHLYAVVRQLFQETGEEDLRVEFALANQLHANFYEEYLDHEEVRFHLDGVERFVERLEAILANGSQ